MTVIEFSADPDSILDHVDQHIRQLADGGLEAKFIIVGQEAYRALCRAISVRNRRGKGLYETYNFIPLVVDPFRDSTVCVVPSPEACAGGVAAYRVGE